MEKSGPLFRPVLHAGGSMNITDTMDLNQLPELIQLGYGPQQITYLRAMLLTSKFQDTEEIPQEVWASLLEEVKVRFLPARD